MRWLPLQASPDVRHYCESVAFLNDQLDVQNHMLVADDELARVVSDLLLYSSFNTAMKRSHVSSTRR